MSRLERVLRSDTVSLMDGAMGTELQRLGSHDGECFELWNLSHPERARSVHQAYVGAGAQVLLTNTFQANPARLAKFTAVDRLEEIFRAAIVNARAAANTETLVLADIGPLNDIDARTASRMAGAVQSADGALLETWSDPRMVQFFADSVAGLEIPLLVSFAFRRQGGVLSTFAGYSPEECAKTAMKCGAALGVNCGRDLTIDDLREIIQRYHATTDLPIFARPNAGTPVRSAGSWVYPQSPATMAGLLRSLLDAGVCMVGGCCGTTPAHIAAFRTVVGKWNARLRQV